METTYENTDYFASLPAARMSAGDWYLLELWLASGERVPVHHTLWCSLLETEEVRSVSRAGIIIQTAGMLVRLCPASDGPAWLQALPIPPGIEDEPGHEHSIIPVELSDGWEVIRCTRCGAEW